MIRIAIVDDHAIVRAGLRQFLAEQVDMTVVAEAANGRCSACQINLRPQFLQDLRKGGQLMFCESCGRLLYYNPPVSFEDAAAVR